MARVTYTIMSHTVTPHNMISHTLSMTPNTTMEDWLQLGWQFWAKFGSDWHQMGANLRFWAKLGFCTTSFQFYSTFWLAQLVTNWHHRPNATSLALLTSRRATHTGSFKTSCEDHLTLQIPRFVPFGANLVQYEPIWYVGLTGMSHCQNVLKLILKSPRFVPFGTNLTQLELNWYPLDWHQQYKAGEKLNKGDN